MILRLLACKFSKGGTDVTFHSVKMRDPGCLHFASEFRRAAPYTGMLEGAEAFAPVLARDLDRCAAVHAVMSLASFGVSGPEAHTET
jgi:hypothetical protein